MKGRLSTPMIVSVFVALITQMCISFSNASLPSSLLRFRRKPQPPEFFLSEEETQRMGVKPTTDFVTLARHILPITGYLGPFLSVDVQLIAKLCRVCSIYVCEFVSFNRIPW